MTSFVDPTVIAEINGSSNTLINLVNQAKPCVEQICAYAGSLPNPLIPEAPIDGLIYGRKDGTWTETGAGGGGVWGQITGNIDEQSDLFNKFANKLNTGLVSEVGFTGKYADLIGKPAVLGEAPQDGQQYARYNASWKVVEFTLPANPTIQGSVTIQGAADSQAEVTLLDPTIDGDYGWHSEHTGGFGYPYDFYTTAQGVFHKKENVAAKRLAFFDELPSPSAGTDISTVQTASNVSVNSNTGSDGVINGATQSLAGVITSVDKTKLDGIATGAQVNTFNFADAPSDTKQYARQDGTWSEVVSSGGGGGGVQGVDYSLPLINYTEVLASALNLAPSKGIMDNWKNKQVFYNPSFTGNSHLMDLQIRSSYVSDWAIGDGFDLIIPTALWNPALPIGQYGFNQFLLRSPSETLPYPALSFYTVANSQKLNTATTSTTYTFQLRVINYMGVNRLVVQNTQFV